MPPWTRLEPNSNVGVSLDLGAYQVPNVIARPRTVADPGSDVAEPEMRVFTKACVQR